MPYNKQNYNSLVCEIRLRFQNPEQLAIFAHCGFRDKTNVPTRFTLQVIVREIHGSFEIKITFWNKFKNYPLDSLAS